MQVTSVFFRTTQSEAGIGAPQVTTVATVYQEGCSLSTVTTMAPETRSTCSDGSTNASGACFNRG